MNKKRIQLTLFVNETESEPIEQIRKEFNPEQHALIKSHVTLCREDELVQFDKVIKNLEKLNHKYITIDFGIAVRFSGGKGVLLPATGHNGQFQKLREEILQEVIKQPRTPDPHITLMHPRNSTCSDRVFQQIEKIKLPARLEFSKISLIEQEGMSNWKILKEYELKEFL